MLDEDILREAASLLDLCRRQKLLLATAESCTGGLVAAALTAIAGSSDVVDRGFVTYSNEAKADCLFVPATQIAQDGAVGEAVARAMAQGALRASRADLAVSVTGIAGPSGGSPQKPVGLVWFGLARRGGDTATARQIFAGDRGEVRRQAVLFALALFARAAIK